MACKTHSDVNNSGSSMHPAAYMALRERTRGMKAAVRGMMARTTDESVGEAEQTIKGALRSVDDDCCSTEGLVDVVKTLEETLLTLFTRLRATEDDLHELRAERLALSAPSRPFSPIAPGDEPAALDRERTKTRALSQMVESLRARNAALERRARPTDALPALRTRVNTLESELAQARSALAARTENARAEADARVEDLEGRAAAAEAARNAMFVDLQGARDDAAGLRAENERLRARERRVQADLQRQDSRSFMSQHRAVDDSDSDAFSLKERHKNMHTSVWLKRSVPVWLPRQPSLPSTSASSSSCESDSPTSPFSPMAVPARPPRSTRRPQTAR